MSSNIVVWCQHWTLEVQLAQTLGINLFSDAEVIQSTELPDSIQTDSRFKVVLVSLMTFKDHQLNTNRAYDLHWADLVICYNTETINMTESELDTFVHRHLNNKNYIIISTGKPQQLMLSPDRCYYNNQHWITKVVSSNHFKDTRKGILAKPKMFDVLLGGYTTDREKIFNHFKNLLDSNIVNITFSRWATDQSKQFEYRSPELEVWEDPEIRKFLENPSTVEERYSANPLDTWCHNANYPVSMSSKIAWDIYSNSWYTIVAETLTDGFDFITEKTAKPLFAKRIFVVFGSQYHLKNLRSKGFKTFDSIIDESYDSIADKNMRFDAAWKQIKFLMTQDPLILYQKVHDILEHNHNLMLQQDSELIRLKKFIATHLPG